MEGCRYFLTFSNTSDNLLSSDNLSLLSVIFSDQMYLCYMLILDEHTTAIMIVCDHDPVVL